MKPIGVLVIHGVGNQQSDFADALITNVHRRLRHTLIDTSEIIWQPIWWNPILAASQTTFAAEFLPKGKMRYLALRKLLIQSANDAIAYESHQYWSRKFAEEIHVKVREGLERLANRLPTDDVGSVPLVVLAHSLGAHIMSNYIWDCQHSGQSSSQERLSDSVKDFIAMRSLLTFVTFGCNIPLFVAHYDQLVPIIPRGPRATECFPEHARCAGLNSIPKWLNIYDPADPLGYPLRGLSHEYRKMVDEDCIVRVGGLIPYWDMRSHMRYWDHRRFARKIAELLSNVSQLMKQN